MSLFVLYLLLIPLFLGFSLDILYYTNTGMVWLCLVFSFLSERLFEQDYEDGSLELYCLSNCSLQWLFFQKVISVWFTQLSTLCVCLPVLFGVYHLEQSFELYITMLLGSFGLSLLLGFYSCFLCGIQSSATSHSVNLQHLIVLPVLLPLVLCCTTLDHSMMQWVVLLAYVMVSVCVVVSFVLITFQALLSQ